MLCQFFQPTIGGIFLNLVTFDTCPLYLTYDMNGTYLLFHKYDSFTDKKNVQKREYPRKFYHKVFFPSSIPRMDTGPIGTRALYLTYNMNGTYLALEKYDSFYGREKCPKKGISEKILP